MTAQSAYDEYANSGGGLFALRKVSQSNPENIPMGFLPSDFGLLGWSIDPADLNSATQAIVSGTQYFVRMSNQANLNNSNSNSIVKVGLHLGGTGAVTPGTYSGFALYSYVPGAATMTKLADTGADDGAAWAAASTNNYVEGTLSAPVSSAPGILYASFIAAFTTMPTIYASSITANTLKIKGKSLSQVYTSASAQTSFAASVSVPGTLVAGTFCPLMGIASS